MMAVLEANSATSNPQSCDETNEWTRWQDHGLLIVAPCANRIREWLEISTRQTHQSQVTSMEKLKREKKMSFSFQR